MGFRPHITADALRFLAGSQFGAFYHLWGFAGLFYAAVVGLRREWTSFRHVPLLLFTLSWWAYFVFYAVPWPQLAVAPMGVTAIFVAMLWRDALWALGIRLAGLLKGRAQEPREHRAVGIALACVMGLTIVVPLERQIRTNVITADRAASEVAAYIERTVEPEEVVETWERELGIMTTRTCHYPDQLLTARAHAAIYHGGPRSYALGEEYFARYRAQYLVVGWFGAALGVYDPDYVREHGQRLASFGPETSRYDVYRLK
jgi:hypothetical protein